MPFKSILDVHGADRYCIPLDSSRPYAEAENRFFSECNPGNGKVEASQPVRNNTNSFTLVPVIAVFTKYDALVIKAYGSLKQAGYTPEDAKDQAQSKAKDDFNRIVRELSGKRHPPRSYIHLTGTKLNNTNTLPRY
jgi:hypothetical protein